MMDIEIRMPQLDALIAKIDALDAKIDALAPKAAAVDGEAPEDEDALRARTAFEAKRVSRTHGVGAMRAAIKRIAGNGMLTVDEVPPKQLGDLLAALQAL
jgi:hypothetical protein